MTISEIKCSLPGTIHIPRKLCILNELAIVDSLLHVLSGDKVVIWVEDRN